MGTVVIGAIVEPCVEPCQIEIYLCVVIALRKILCHVFNLKAEITIN